MTHLVGREDHPQRELLAGRDLLRHLQRQLDDGALRPLVADLGDVVLALKPQTRQAHLLLPALQLQHLRHQGVGGQESVAAVLAVSGAAVVVGGVAGSRILGIAQRHVALTALHGPGGVAFLVPVARLPVIELVLQLHPAHLIHFLVDELLVAGGAILGCLEHALAQLVVLLRVGADEEVPRHTLRPGIFPLPQVLALLGDHVVCIALQVGLPDGMARQAGDALLIALQAGEILHEQVLGAGEQRDGIVAAAAVARGLRAILLGHDLLDSLEQHVHGGPAVRTHAPLVQDLRVAARRTAGLRAGQRARVEGATGVRARQARGERTVLAVEEVVVLGELVLVHRAGVHGSERHHGQQAQPSDQRRGAYVAGGEFPRSCFLEPWNEQQQVGSHAEQDGKRRVQVNVSPHRRRAHSEQPLPCHHQARQRAHEQGHHRHVAQQDHVGQAVVPVVEPVSRTVPGDGKKRQDAQQRVQEQAPLHAGMERPERNEQAAHCLEHEDSHAQAGQKRSPPGANGHRLLRGVVHPSLSWPGTQASTPGHIAQRGQGAPWRLQATRRAISSWNGKLCGSYSQNGSSENGSPVTA